MSKARWADGLRRGSTKTKTYSTLSTRKEGRVQIIKDRVYDVANPQTISQMQQRVIFATVTSAAKHMYPLISISQEGETNPEYARQLFISQNVELLKRTVGKRVGLQRHYLSAFAPKGNEQIIPNSYQVSKGSLMLPYILVPKTRGSEEDEQGGSTFQYSAWAHPGLNVGGIYVTQLEPIIAGQTYTAAQLWEILFGLKPGDQLTFPQIYGNETAQTMSDGNEIIDKTLVTTFVAPRIVLKENMPEEGIKIVAETAASQVIAALKSGVNTDDSFTGLADRWLNTIEVDETEESQVILAVTGSYAYIFGVATNVQIRALGVILSRKDANGKWQYSTSNLVCVWDFISVDDGADYFGFTLDNAISTYLATAQTDANGNFLQHGGESDIVPESFG